jgi:hypothetical protein
LGADKLEVGADGQLGRVSFGAGGGAAVICQLDPRALNADKQTYLRFTRWREMRALSQVLANCGAAFKSDKDIFASAEATPTLAALYHPDYRRGGPSDEDFRLGDDPYRYFRW